MNDWSKLILGSHPSQTAPVSNGQVREMVAEIESLRARLQEAEKENEMNKQDYIELIKLISALESWSFAEKHRLPDYLLEKIADSLEKLQAEVLK